MCIKEESGECEPMNGCLDRLEFQQKPIKVGLVTYDRDQWCSAREGTWVKQGRNTICKTKNTQGTKNI